MGMNTYLFAVACGVLLAFFAAREIPERPHRLAREETAKIEAVRGYIESACRVRNAGHPAVDVICKP
jgi:hypothetical protein